MDKQEYKILSEEIMSLAGNEQFQEAAQIADRIDWRKVRSFSMLMKISELYQLNRRYDDALELMLMAYDRNPRSRSIVYSLTELYIQVENHVKALEFFALYKRMAPNDSGVYILQYKLQELEGVSPEDQIALLEEFNRKDYREEWAYQLAYLYHRIGLGTKCVETCNELITWFGEGPFVIKAMELKMLHAKLSPEQMEIYRRRDSIADQIHAYESDEYTTESPEPGLNPEIDDMDFHVKTIDMGKFNTMNLQKALAESMRELMGEEAGGSKNETPAAKRPAPEEDFMSTAEMEERMKHYETEGLEEDPGDAWQQQAYPDEAYNDGSYADPGSGYGGGSYADMNGGYAEGNYSDGNYGDVSYADANGAYGDGNYTDGNYADGSYADANGAYGGGNYADGSYADANGAYGDGSYTDGSYADANGAYGDGNYTDGSYADANGAYGDGNYTDGSYADANGAYGSGNYADGNYADANGAYGSGNYADGNYADVNGAYGNGYAGGDYAGPEAAYPNDANAGAFDIKSAFVQPAAQEEDKGKKAFDLKSAFAPSAQIQEDPFESVPGELASEPEGVEDQTIYFEPVRSVTGSAAKAVAAAPATPKTPAPKPIVKTEKKPGGGTVIRVVQPAASVKEGEVFFEDHTEDIVIDNLPSGTNPEYESIQRRARELQQQEADARQNRIRRTAGTVEQRTPRPEHNVMDEMLYQDADGQIGLAVPDSVQVEKQITGQIHIDEYLSDWEKTKQRRKEAQDKDLQRSIIERTGQIFKDYDARKKNGLIEEMEREQKIFSEKYQADDIRLRSMEEMEDEAAGEAGSDGRSIWDEVQEAIDADHQAKAHVEKRGRSTVGFVDAAVTGSSGLAFGGREEMREIMAENEPQPSIWDEVDAAREAEEAALAAEENTEEAVVPAEEEQDYSEPGLLEKTPEEVWETGTVTEEEAHAIIEAQTEAGEEALEQPEAEAVPEAAEEGETEPAPEEVSEYTEEAGEENEWSEEGYPEEGEYWPEEEAPYEETGEEDGELDQISGALEADADRVGSETVEEMNDDYVPEEENELTTDEQKLFSDFLYSKKMRAQLLAAIDQISLAPYVGNAIITGDNEEAILDLGKALIKEIQMIDNNFVSSRVAKISGTKMNRRDIPTMFNQLAGGALLVERASDITKETLETMAHTLDGMTEGIFVILMDSRRDMDRMIEEYELITGYFNARIDIAPMNNNALVDYAKKYAYSMEYKIDEERGVLALHQCIAERQIGEHNVTPREIEEIVDEAIEYSRKPHLSTFFQLLAGKRYDYEDMIVLREKDFLHKRRK